MASVRYRQSAEVDGSVVGDRAVLYHRRRRSALVLNPAGAWLWSRMDSPVTVEGLQASLRERFPHLSAERAAEDVSAFLGELSRHDAVAIQE